MQSASTSTSTTTTPRKWWAMLGIGMGVFMSTLDGGIVNIALPTLQRQFDTTLATVQWVAVSYLLVVTASMLSVARLGDMFGKKRFYLVGLVLFTVGSLLCGLAPDVGWLIAFRALQGSGAVMMMALGSAIITEVFPASERGRALGISGAIVSVGIALGPTVGGVLIGTVGWRVVFLINVPVGIATVLVVSRVVPPSVRGEAGQRFDLLGALVMLGALVCYTLGMTRGQDAGFGDLPVLALLAGAVIGLAAFVYIETHVKQPMIDLALFQNVLLGVNLLMAFLVFIVLSGLFIFPFFLELVKGYPTEQVGLFVAVVPVSMGLVSPVSGALSDRFGSRLISIVGLLIIVAACLLIGTLHHDVTPLGYVARLAPLGVGIGIFQSPNNSAIMGTASRERLGVASGLMALSRTLGQTTGIPLIGVLFTTLVMNWGNGFASAVSVAGGQYAPAMVLHRFAAGGGVTAAPAGALVFGTTNTFRIAALVILLAAGLAVYAWRFDRRAARQTGRLSAPLGEGEPGLSRG
jgi:EmrB/QacA subfamily drug resistance transporter